jgi:phosphatidylethanolamine-binding protein (PEBP) family uncharacterized protein
MIGRAEVRGRQRHGTTAYRRTTLAARGFVLLLAVVLAGCGGSKSSGTTTATATTATTAAAQNTQSTTTDTTPTKAPVKKQHVPRIEKVSLSSPALNLKTAQINAVYTCAHGDATPPMHWSGIPAGTKELMLDVLNLDAVENKLYIDWSVANLDPHTHSLTAGRLPARATVGVNSTGTTKYTICPTAHSTGKYVAVLFALPHKLPTQNGYDAATLREQALADANYEGFLLFNYTRH